MKFCDIPVGMVFVVNGIQYRKENTCGKSRMLCNATIVDGREDPTWVFFDLEAQIPFPDQHAIEVLNLISTEVECKGTIVDFRMEGPPNCEISYKVQGDDTETWYSIKQLIELGVNVPFAPKDTRKDWELNIGDRVYVPSESETETETETETIESEVL